MIRPNGDRMPGRLEISTLETQGEMALQPGAASALAVGIVWTDGTEIYADLDGKVSEGRPGGTK